MCCFFSSCCSKPSLFSIFVSFVWFGFQGKVDDFVFQADDVLIEKFVEGKYYNHFNVIDFELALDKMLLSEYEKEIKSQL